MVTPNVEGAEAVDLTSFASFSSPDEKVLAPITGQPGVYTGIEYSSDAGLQPEATIGKILKLLSINLFMLPIKNLPLSA